LVRDLLREAIEIAEITSCSRFIRQGSGLVTGGFDRIGPVVVMP
jgi:hypothetical protein